MLKFNHMRSKRDSAQPSQFTPGLNHPSGNTPDDSQRRRQTHFAQSSMPPFPIESQTPQNSQQEQNRHSDLSDILLAGNFVTLV